MPIFICPNCGNRSESSERTAGFQKRAKGCKRCGFGFLFELLDDYYPAPNAAFFVCDQQARVIGCGRGSRELTGLSDEKVIGRPVRDVLGLDFSGGEDHVGVVLEWGVRQLGKEVVVNAEGDLPAKAVADLFPAYDDDGGLLLVLWMFFPALLSKHADIELQSMFIGALFALSMLELWRREYQIELPDSAAFSVGA